MMKKWLTIVLMIGLLLTGCTSNQQADDSSAADVSTTDTTTKVSFDGAAFEDTMDSCLGWGTGTAGSGLSAMSAAVNFLTFVADNDTVQAKASIQKAAVSYFKDLNDDQRTTIIENYKVIAGDVQGLIDQDEDVTAMLSDIGAEKTVEEALKKDDVKDRWTELNEVMESIIDQYNA